MLTEILELSEDELLAFRESQESRRTTSDTDASESDDSGKDGFATDTNKNDYESPESDYQDATGAGYDSVEEYYTAEEDDATGLACHGECPS